MTNPSKIFYEKNEWYSFTLAPSDAYQYAGKKDRLKKFTDLMYESFLALDSSKIKYRFDIDISEPKNIQKSIGPRLHIHGRLLFPCSRSILDWQLMHAYSLSRIGILDIDTIEDISIWDKYCEKYKHITKLKTYKNYTPMGTLEQKKGQ